MKAKIIGISIAAAVVAAMIYAIIFIGPIQITPNQKTQDPYKDWNRSGPFAINKFEYKLGENIFISVNGLFPSDTGTMNFILPDKNTTYIGIPFDGTEKTSFNQYFSPQISASREICSTKDLVGDWTVVFEGANYRSLHFKMLNETIPGEERSYFDRVC